MAVYSIRQSASGAVWGTRFPATWAQTTEKELAAEAAAELVEDGMTVGLGTGSTVAHLLPALAARGLDLRCVATSVADRGAGDGARHRGRGRSTRLDAARHRDRRRRPGRSRPLAGQGRRRRPHAREDRRRRGGAIRRHRRLEQAGRRASLRRSRSSFTSSASPRPLPGWASSATCSAATRPPSPDGGVIADYFGDGRRPRRACGAARREPGVVDHGLFPPQMVSDVLVGRGERGRAALSR